MEKNVGGLDRTARIALGPLLIAAAVASMLGKRRLGSALTAGAFAVGAILAVSGLTRQCPGNAALGRNTYRPSDRLSEEAQEVRERATQERATR